MDAPTPPETLELRRYYRAFTPRKIYDLLSLRIVGQDDAKRQVALWVYAHLQGYRPSPLLVVGPTACGKTEMFRILNEKFDICAIWDASQLTAEGWSGGIKLSTICEDMARWDKKILVLDEFDKLVKPAYNGSGQTNYSHITQSQLLKLFDHDVLTFKANTGTWDFDSADISIACTGAFSYVREKKVDNSRRVGFGADNAPRGLAATQAQPISIDDAITAGMMPELAGRIGPIVSMDAPTEDDYKVITKKMLSSVGRMMHKTLTLSKSAISDLAAQAAARGLGARWIRSEIERMAYAQLWTDPEAESYQL